MFADKNLTLGTPHSKEFPPVLDIFETSIFAISSAAADYTDFTQQINLDIEKESNFLKIITELRSELIMMMLGMFEHQRQIMDDMLRQSKFCNSEIKGFKTGIQHSLKRNMMIKAGEPC